MENTKPFLRWAGSKKKLLPILNLYWGEGYSRYLEPFMGSAQLFFKIDAPHSIISDSNLDLIHVYNQIKKDPYPIYKILCDWEISKWNYYTIRSLNPRSLGINQRAARFIYLNRLCFNGLYRTNNSGHFNVPYSGEKPRFIQDYDNLKKVSKKLKTAEIIHGDFEQIIKSKIKEGDFVYLDPPYAVENKRIFNQYGPQTFGLEDLKRLKDLLVYIGSKKARFLMSYASCPEVEQMFSDWYINKTHTNRNIAGFAKFRRSDEELLISNIAIKLKNGR